MKKLLLFISIICIKQANAQIISTIAGTGAAGFSGDGAQATAAKLTYPTGLSIDKSGNIYVADYSSNVVRKINAAGVITTIAGNNTQGSAGDGSQATAANLYDPTGVTVDAAGNIFIADDDNNKIRKVDNTGKITTYCGDGFVGYFGDNVAASTARLDSPWGIITDKHKNIYFADLVNHIVRKIDSLGIITTIAGTPGTFGYAGDGAQATAAKLNYPATLAISASGNLYIADRANNVIRMINTAGVISTVAGTNTQGYSGDGGQATQAELGLPFGIDVDAQDNLYIADQVNNVIRKVDATGIITTIAGNGTQGYNSDGINATLAQLNLPRDVKVDSAGNLYIADSNNSRIRKVTAPVTTAIKQLNNTSNLTIYPNPAQNNFTVQVSSNEKQNISVYDINGKLILSQTIQGTTNIDACNFNAGVYNINLTNSTGITNKRLVIVK